MPEKLTTRLFNNLRDSFQSDWKLLSETEHFLASTPLQQNYEQQFAVWRKRLQTAHNDAARASVREEIITLRKSLRVEGYDLSLGYREKPIILNLPVRYRPSWNVSGDMFILKCIIFGFYGNGMPCC